MIDPIFDDFGDVAGALIGVRALAAMEATLENFSTLARAGVAVVSGRGVVSSGGGRALQLRYDHVREDELLHSLDRAKRRALRRLRRRSQGLRLCQNRRGEGLPGADVPHRRRADALADDLVPGARGGLPRRPRQRAPDLGAPRHPRPAAAVAGGDRRRRGRSRGAVPGDRLRRGPQPRHRLRGDADEPAHEPRAHPPARLLRPGHRAFEPREDQDRRRGAARRARPRRARRLPVHGPQPLQGHQRHLRPQGRRQSPAHRRGPPQRLLPRREGGRPGDGGAARPRRRR